MSLFGYAQPMIYILFIVIYPITNKRFTFLILSFLLGLSIDFFSNSGGINAAASLFIAYLRLPILKMVSGRAEFDPVLFNIKSMVFSRQVSYLFTLIIIHHYIIFQLTYFKFSALLSVFAFTLFSSIFTFILLLFLSSLFINKKR
jgi:rod shape-determining protein MreD